MTAEVIPIRKRTEPLVEDWSELPSDDARTAYRPAPFDPLPDDEPRLPAAEVRARIDAMRKLLELPDEVDA